MPTSEQKTSLITGTPKHLAFADITTPGTEQNIFAYTVVDTNFKLYQLRLSLRGQSIFKLYDGTDLIASGRTGAAQNNPAINWSVPRPVANGNILTLKLKAHGEMPSSDVEAFLDATI